MGTHPIFESDFDCLTDCRKKKKLQFRQLRRKNDLTIAQLRDRLVKQVSPQIRPHAPIRSFPPISPASSYFRVTVPLSDEHFPMRLKYRRADDGVRMGRCLEDLDTIAGIASYLH